MYACCTDLNLGLTNQIQSALLSFMSIIYKTNNYAKNFQKVPTHHTVSANVTNLPSVASSLPQLDYSIRNLTYGPFQSVHEWN